VRRGSRGACPCTRRAAGKGSDGVGERTVPVEVKLIVHLRSRRTNRQRTNRQDVQVAEAHVFVDSTVLVRPCIASEQG
jgi:hypothetical protein